VDVENNFLQKPFTLKQLAGKIRVALDRNCNSHPFAAEVVAPPSVRAGSG